MKESIKKKFESIDQSKIKVDSTKELLAKIEKALNGKNEENVNKAEALLDKFIAQAKGKKADIFVSKKAEPTLTPTEKKKAKEVVKSKLDKLMETISKDPLLKDFNNARRSKGGGKSDALIDSERKARESGVRVSKKGWKNQYGKSAGGRKYYEYRENRIDRKAPNYGDRPWLKEGGFIHPSDANADKFVIVEIKEDGSRREHNNFGDLQTARMFASLKREFLPKGSKLIIEDKNGKNLYRSFKTGGYMADGGEIEWSATRKAENTNITNEELKKDYNDAKFNLSEFRSGNLKPSKVIGGGYKSSVVAKRLAEEYLESQVQIYKRALTKRGIMAKGGKVDESTEMVLSQNKAIAHHTEELKKALAKVKSVEPWVVGKIERASTDISDVTHYLDGKTKYAKGGKIKGDSLDNVREDAKTLSRNSKQDIYLLEEKHYEFSNGNDKRVVTQFTVATQEDVDYIKEMPKNHLVVSFKILGKYSNGELKSTKQEVLFSDGSMMEDGGKVRWQDVYVGDSALVIAENKMGLVVKPYGRRFHLRFPDGSEKTYSAEELEFYKDDEFAKGGYVKRKNIKLIYVKNPNKNGSNKFLKIDKRDFLDGLHKFEDGGKLTDDYTYIKRSDVSDVVYSDAQTSFASDKNPKNGFWVRKQALVDAGMNATEKSTTKLDFGITSVRKGENGWKAKNTVKDYKGYDWEITTMKSLRGDLITRAVGGKTIKHQGYSTFEYVMYQDPNITLMTSKPARITDKAVSEQHEKALKEFESKVSEKYAKGGHIGFEKLSSKVAKSYEGDKVKPKYQKEYGKTYDKAEAKEVGNKVAAKVYREQLAKMEYGGQLPEELDRYFIKTRKTKVVEMSDLIPLRARNTGIANAEKYMKMAYDGKMDKRKPITIYKSGGKYRILDGNSTYAVAKANGWETIWAEVVKNSNMNHREKRGKDIFTLAKEIRKEGEPWKDALQRAKLMK